MFRKLIQIVLFLLIACLLVASFIAYQFFNKPLLQHPPAISIIIQPGSSLSRITKQLQQQGLMPYPKLFIAYALLKHNEHLLKAGEYQIDPSMTAPGFLMNMVAGNVILHKITFIEGWTFQDVRQALNQNPFITHETQALSNAEIMQKMSSKRKSPEGLFFPETYSFTRGDKDLQVLQRAYDKMNDILAFEWKERSMDLPYSSAYKALIAASLIEKETAFPGERPQVSGVIARRLEKGMRLQIDASLFYGLDQPMTYKLTKADLLKDTPYNTYVHDTLPPSPICMPSEESIYAALHPDKSDNLYYVARGDGSNEFSASYEKHQKAVEQYILKATTPKPSLPETTTSITATSAAEVAQDVTKP